MLYLFLHLNIASALFDSSKRYKSINYPEISCFKKKGKSALSFQKLSQTSYSKEKPKLTKEIIKIQCFFHSLVDTELDN